MSLLHHILKVASPAAFASTASGGRWQYAPHLTLINRVLLETLNGTSPPILIIEAPPRHGKSELISKYLPAWYLGAYPDRRVMLTAYAATFARSWGRKARELLIEFGPNLFESAVSDSVRSAAEWGIAGHEGGMVTAGIGGPLTGRGADLLIIDDPIKNAEEALSDTIREKHWDWWQSTAYTRLEPRGIVVVIATRWHSDDLSGRLIRMSATGEGPSVRRLHFPAIAGPEDELGRPPGAALWPARWPIAMLENQRATRDPRWWESQYQQQPRSREGSAWPDSYFTDLIWMGDFPAAFELSAMGVDPSLGRRSGDYSAIVCAGFSGGVIWVDANLERRSPEQLVSDALDFAARWRPQIIGLETNAFQQLLAPEFHRQSAARRMPLIPLLGVSQTVDKEVRIARLGPFLLTKQIRLRPTAGCRRLLQQLRDYPLSAHDDGPDALELAIRMICQLSGRGVTEDGLAIEIARA